MNSAAYDKDGSACQCKNGKTSGDSSDLMDSQVAEEASCSDDAASQAKADKGFTEEQVSCYCSLNYQARPFDCFSSPKAPCLLVQALLGSVLEADLHEDAKEEGR